MNPADKKDRCYDVKSKFSFDELETLGDHRIGEIKDLLEKASSEVIEAPEHWARVKEAALVLAQYIQIGEQIGMVTFAADEERLARSGRERASVMSRPNYMVLRAFQMTLGLRIDSNVVVFLPRNFEGGERFRDWIETSVKTRMTRNCFEIRVTFKPLPNFDSFEEMDQ